jgi:excisionase family DNA binding protein
MAKKEYLSIAEAAASLGCHENTVRRYVKRGLLPHFRIFGKFQFIAADLDHFRQRFYRSQVKGGRRQRAAEFSRKQPNPRSPLDGRDL